MTAPRMEPAAQPQPGQPTHTPATIASALARRLENSIDNSAEAGFPVWAHPLGAWNRVSDGNWVGGFPTGALWTRPETTELARAALRSLLPRLQVDSAFNGFVFYYGASLGARLTDDDFASETTLEAAQRLAAAADDRIGVIPLGVDERHLQPAGTPGVLTYIDAVGPTVALLAHAAELGGPTSLLRLAERHALWHLEALSRSDGSTAQAATFEPETGEVLHVFTASQGLSATSTWARSQAWAMLTCAMTATALPHLAAEMVSRAARQLAWWVDHTPSLIPTWDFDAPTTDPADTSAAAIMCTAALRLARLPSLTSDQRADFEVAGRSTFTALTDQLLVKVEDHRPTAALPHGCYHRPKGLAIDAELVWGDWYLLEAADMLRAG